MGLERRLFERKNRNIQTNDSDDCAQRPLPMAEIEGPDSPNNFREQGLLVVPSGNDEDRTVGVVLGRWNVLSPVPISDGGNDAHSSTPNVMYPAILAK